ncbi:hypothetical protein BH11PSE12_BH11PSE12_33310 [soil metagenome]
MSIINAPKLVNGPFGQSPALLLSSIVRAKILRNFAILFTGFDARNSATPALGIGQCQ